MKQRKEKNDKSNIIEETNAKRWKGWEKIPVYGLCIFLIISMGFVAVASIIETSVEVKDKSEKIIYVYDNIFINILFLIVVIVITYFLYTKFYDQLKKINEKYILIAIFVYTLVIGLVWVLNVQSIPATDSGTVFKAAVGAAKDNFDFIKSNNNSYLENLNYFKVVPFQLGFVFISEIIYRIFGTGSAISLEVINVVALAIMYVVLLKMSKLLFESKGVQFILAIFLAMTIQPILLCGFAYGNIIGFSAAIVTCYFTMLFLNKKGKISIVYLVIAVVCVTLSILAKYNNMICVIAIVIAVALYVIKNKQWVKSVSILLILIVPILSQNLVISSYESRAGIDFGEGLGQMSYLDVGLGKSQKAPGWYSRKHYNIYRKTNGDREESDKLAKKEISERLTYFKEHPGYTVGFFTGKIVSQWNEPEYDSIWVTRVKKHYNGEVKQGSILYSIYWGKLGDYLHIFCDKTQMLMFVLFVVAMIAMMKRRQKIETSMLMLILVGAFLYHLLFEGKSQYIATYYILISFFASYGMFRSLNYIRGKHETIRRKN